MKTSKVVLLDLRTAPGDQPAGAGGGIVVIDDADSLVKHAETYMTLLGDDMVTGVVCVAIGESDTDDPTDGVVLTMPPALRYATVLWIGDPHGMDWAPGDSHPRPVEGTRIAIDDLVAVLQVPRVFDRVVAMTEHLPAGVANPAIRLVSSAAEPGELATARAAAVRSLCTAEHAPSQAVSDAIQRIDAAHDPTGAVLTGQVSTSRTEAVKRLNHVAVQGLLLTSWKALVGRDRPTAQLGNHATWAGQAAENHRRVLVELLDRMDGQLQVGNPSVENVMELGVQDPAPARGVEIAAALQQAVDSRLKAGASLALIAQEMRLAAAGSTPQGCTAALEEVRRRGPLTVETPVFRTWPLHRAVLPLIFLTCATMAVLLGSGQGWVGAVLLAVAWYGAGWLLLGRRPGPQGEFGLDRATWPAACVYGSAAVLGAAAGVATTILKPDLFGVSPLTGQVLAVALVVVSAVTVVLSWRSAVRQWLAGLRTDIVLSTLTDLTRLTEEVVVREWQPMRRRRAIAIGASVVADGLEEIVQALDYSGPRLFIAPDGQPPGTGEAGTSRPAVPELYTVIRGDLTDLCRAALAPVWPAAEAGQRAPREHCTRRLDQLLGGYGAHVRLHGLITAPEFSRDLVPRDALTNRIWSELPAALSALRTEVDGDMTQMCRSGQLRYLSTSSAPGLLRFAPLQLRRVLETDIGHQGLATDPGIEWSGDGEFVGAMRLSPLRAESVRHVFGGER